jgi:hypothetical protein
MTTTEIDTVTQAEINELAALTGADPSANMGTRTAELKINYSTEDADEVQLPLGQLFITQQETPAYAKNVKIRPLAMHYQYTDFDSDSNKMRSQTVKNLSFSEDFLDSIGGVRCGRPDSTTYKDMSDDRREMYKSISCTRHVSCLVSYEGKDSSGNAITVENVPAILRCKGANFMGFDEQLYKKLPKGRKMWDYWAEISLKKEKKGSVTYYVMNYDIDLNNPVALDRPTIDTIRYFADLVEIENGRIYEAHKKALAKKTQDSGTYDSIAGGVDLDGDFAVEDAPF